MSINQNVLLNVSLNLILGKLYLLRDSTEVTKNHLTALDEESDFLLKAVEDLETTNRTQVDVKDELIRVINGFKSTVNILLLGRISAHETAKLDVDAVRVTYDNYITKLEKLTGDEKALFIDSVLKKVDFYKKQINSAEFINLVSEERDKLYNSIENSKRFFDLESPTVEALFNIMQIRIDGMVSLFSKASASDIVSDSWVSLLEQATKNLKDN